MEREREREGRRKGGGDGREMERGDLYVLYTVSEFWRLKRGKKERKEKRKIESRKIEIWWKDLD